MHKILFQNPQEVKKKKVDNSNYDGEGTNIKRKRENYIKMS